MQVSRYNQIIKTEPPSNWIEVVLDERLIFQLEVSVGGRGLLLGDCVESAMSTGRVNRQRSRPGVGRMGNRDVCAVVASGGST